MFLPDDPSSPLTFPHRFPSCSTGLPPGCPLVFHLFHHHPTWMPLLLLLTQEQALTCVFPPASTRRLVVASVAELGKHEKTEETRLETP